MGINSYASVQDNREFQSHFNNTLNTSRTGPLKQRKCNDICCLIFLILILTTFTIMGAYYISTIPADTFTPHSHYRRTVHSQTTTNTQFAAVDMVPAIPTIIGMCVLSVALAVGLTCLIAKYPKCVFYTMVVLTCTLLLVAGGAMLYAGQIAGLVLFAVVILIIVVLMCKKRQIELGMQIMQNSGQFIVQKPTTLFIPFVVGIFSVLFIAFWAYALIGMVTKYNSTLDSSSNSSGGSGNNSTTTNGSTTPNQLPLVITIWLIFFTFFSIYLFYITVFLIGTAFALWYFNINDNYLIVGLSNLFRSHLGSLTFAAVIVTILRTLRDQVSKARNHSNSNNAAGIFATQCILCCLHLCLSTLQQLAETLNNNAILIMALTGEGFVDAAKTAFHAIMSNFVIFLIVQAINEMLMFFAMLLISVLPSILGYLLLNTFTFASADQKNTFLLIGVAIIFVSCLIIGNIFITVISQSLSAVLIYYCMNYRLKESGKEIDTPPELQSAAVVMSQIGGNYPSHQMSNRQY